MIKTKILILSYLILSFSFCQGYTTEQPSKVKVGAEILVESFIEDLEGKSVGLVMNPTARINGTHVLDTLLSLDVDIKALFAPEHGFRGDVGAGELIRDGIDEASGLPVYSLYGSNKKPTSEMLSEIDVLLFDMQDVGARFYTYNTTMKYILEAGAESDKEVWILDRPNPAGGNYVAGWILEEEFESFVGAYPIPIAHGLTLGELAQMAIGEGWLNNGSKPNLKVIKMEGWNREMKWPETGLAWLPPSPNLPTFEHAFVYLGTCLFEGTTLSEGRGTDNPFLTIGSPYTEIQKEQLKILEEKYDIRLDSASFTPVSLPGKASSPKYEDELSYGVKISSRPGFKDPLNFGIDLMKLLMQNTKGAEYKDYLFLLTGSEKVLADSVSQDWGESFSEFLNKRKQYLLYD